MAKIKQQGDLSKIIFILNNGHFEGYSRKKVFLAFSAVVGVFLGLIILSVTMISIEQVNNSRPIGEFIGLIVGFVVAFSLLPAIWLIIILRNEKIRNKVAVWIQDAILINAYAKNIGTKYWIGVPLIKLQVEFELGGIKYVRTTETEQRSLFDIGRPVGYFAHLSKYSNRQIKILYSPKYDQVMILKD